MNQKELIKAIVDEAAERGLKVSQTDVKELLNVVETVIDDAILDGQVVKAFGVKFEQVEKLAASGITKLGGEEKSWSKPKRLVPSVKYLKSKKDTLTVEI